jgi:hypothetical protein
MNTKIIVVALVAIVIAAGGYMFPKVQNHVGSVVGPDSYFEYVANNGLQKYGQTVSLQTATTTVCAIKSPAATSTLVFAGVRFSTSSTTASTVSLAQATTAYATTTNINTYAVSANAQATIVASTTGSVAGDATIFAPNTFFVVGMAGGIGTFSPVGSCSAEFVRI